MVNIEAKVSAVLVGAEGEIGKVTVDAVHVELDGIIGDRHRSYTRKTWSGDKQPKGTLRRNERQWSAISEQELTEISIAMNLEGTLTPADVGVNFCFTGIVQLSRLPKGTLLTFPSGAQLLIEEYNPPCRDIGKSIAGKYRTKTGDTFSQMAFSKAASLSRGVVGVVEVPGQIATGDVFKVQVYMHPTKLERTSD